ncbi:Endothelin-converting enzyme 1 [Acropora cervicornis]|uniref:Endothelin-converting enzyme 1 n=1 Tax=Acropora cervicornis TaxID=6130 RepID=A0AAD9QNQ7_ACRCE|nr:Endothelin-converting enzyme 1 [Acropora cervicornis]
MSDFREYKDVTFAGRKWRSQSQYLLVVALAVIALSLLVLSIVFITLYALEKAKSSTLPAEQEGGKEIKYCGTKSCFDATLGMFKQLNQSIDPCVDFYEYACGGWEKENALGPGDTSVTGFSLVRAKTYNILKYALENAKANYSSFYNACVDATRVEAQGDGSMKKLIEEMGGWFVTGNVTPLSSMSIIQRIGKVQSELLARAFVQVTVFVDPHDSSRHIMQFRPGEVGMIKGYYSRNNSDGIVVREAYKTYMKKVAKLLGGGADSDTEMMKVFALENSLATLKEDSAASSFIESLRKELPGGTATFNRDYRTTIEELASSSTMKLDKFVELVNTVFKRQDREFEKDEKIVAHPPSYFIRLFDLLANKTKTDPETVVNYIIWTVIHQFIKVMPQAYRDAYNDYIVTVTGNRTEDRWIECINGMQAVFAMPLGLLFVDAAFDERSKTVVTKMTRMVKDEFIKNIDSLEWMSDHTKAKAKEKASAILEDIGYPSYIKNPKAVASDFKELKVGDMLFENTASAKLFYADTIHASLDKPVDKDQWFLGPAQVNEIKNKSVFLAAILQPPFYNPSDPTHFDKDGNLNNWWSLRSFAGFNTRAICLAKQYSQFEVYGQKINGNQTMNENIADNGGIKLAYEAYKTLIGQEGSEGALPALGLTEDQLFFVGVIGTLQNYDKFAEAFKCQPGSPMNPRRKCSLW